LATFQAAAMAMAATASNTSRSTQEQCKTHGTLHGSEEHGSKDHVRDLLVLAPPSQESPKPLDSSNAASKVPTSTGRQELEEADVSLAELPPDVSLAELPPEDDVMEHEGSTTEESRSPSPCRRTGASEIGTNPEVNEPGSGDSLASCVSVELSSERISVETTSEFVAEVGAVDLPGTGDSLATNVGVTDTSEKAALNSIVEVAKGVGDSLASHVIVETSSEKTNVSSSAEVVAGVSIATAPGSEESLASRVSAESSEKVLVHASLEIPAATKPASILPSTSGLGPIVLPAVSTPQETTALATTAPVAAPSARLVPAVSQDSSEKVLTKSLLDALDAAERSDPQLKPTTLPTGSGAKPPPTPAQQAALSKLMRLTNLGRSQTNSAQSSVQSSETSAGVGPAAQEKSIPQAPSAVGFAQLPIPPPPPGPPPPDIAQAPLVAGLSWAGVPLPWAHLSLSHAQLIQAAMSATNPPRPPY